MGHRFFDIYKNVAERVYVLFVGQKNTMSTDSHYNLKIMMVESFTGNISCCSFREMSKAMS